jgi:HEAT repeat protein
MNLILDWKPPNSLVIQHCLRLLVAQRGVTGSVAATDDLRQMAVDKVVDSLSRSRSEASGLLTAMLENETGARVRGAIALALAETGDPSVTPQLMEMLRKERGEASWGAADGLIALNDRSVIPKLVQWYQAIQSKNDIRHAADKWRILYILGWMHAEEGQVLKQDAWNSRWPRLVGRGIDLTWLLRHAEGDGAFLLERLQYILTNPVKPDPWTDEWVQKRLVRALARLGVTAALPDLQRFNEQLRAVSGKSAKLERLTKAVAESVESLMAQK